MNVPMDDSTSMPKKSRHLSFWFGGFMFVLLLLFLGQLFGPDTSIVVSPQTTYITAPLRANGMPDYLGWLLEQRREGVTPQNNAAVLMWQAMWPGELDEEHHLLICSELGIDPVPSEQESLKSMYESATRRRLAAWLHEQGRLGVDGHPPSKEAVAAISNLTKDIWPLSEEAYELLDVVDEVSFNAMARSWTSDSIPPLAQWVTKNQKPLDLLLAASRRPRYFSPSPSQLDDSDDSLIAMLLPAVQSAREAARALSVRAMWHLGEGRPEEAWQDLLAIHRLARHVGGGETLVENLVGIAIDGIAIEATQSLLDGGDLTAQQARRVERDLAALPNWASMADSLDRMERMSFLDMTIRLATGEMDDRNIFGGSGFIYSDDVLTALCTTSIDWNVVLEQGNQWYDRLAAAARLPTRAARQTALARLDADVDLLGQELQRSAAIVEGVVSRLRRSELMAASLLNLTLPAVSAAVDAEDRANMRFELLRLAAALAVYRAEHDRYPEKLDDLMPGLIDTLPVDIYSGQPMIYKPDEDGAGYVLYSVSQNGVDDGGTNRSGSIIKGEWVDDRQEVDYWNEADLVIRLPLPLLKLPDVVTNDASSR